MLIGLRDYIKDFKINSFSMPIWTNASVMRVPSPNICQGYLRVLKTQIAFQNNKLKLYNQYINAFNTGKFR